MSKIDLSKASKAKNSQQLNSRVVLNKQLAKLRSYIIQSDEKGLPRFGVLSLLARRVPFYLYDNTAFVQLCNTAFTDGIHVFIHVEFFEELLAEDQQRDGFGLKSHSTLLVLLHELCHILFRHHARLPPNAPPLLWSISCDIAINTRLLKGYPQLRPGVSFDDAWGTKGDEVDKYFGVSEEHIVNELWEDPLNEDEAFITRLKKALVDQSSSPPTAIDELDERGQKMDAHRHLIDPSLIAKTLDDNQLGDIRKKLNLPDSNDKAAFEKLREVNNLFMLEDIEAAKEIRQTHPAGGTMAGDHIETALSEWIEDYYRGQLDWKNLLRDLIVGDGVRYDHCDETPEDIYYVPPEQMGLEAHLYVGSQVPASPRGNTLFVVDTSNSVKPSMLKIFLGEIQALLEHEDIESSNLHLMTADSAIRGDVLSLGDYGLDELPEKLLLHGRGGTDLSQVIKQSLHWIEENQIELNALVYFSDLMDRPPIRQQLPEVLPKMLFLTPPSGAVKNFKNAVADFALVAEIKEGTVIDMNRVPSFSHV